MRIPVTVIFFLLLLLPACGDAPTPKAGNLAPTAMLSSTPERNTPSLATDATAPTAQRPLPAITIAGQVREVDSGARLIHLTRQVQGIDLIRVSADTRIVQAGGKTQTLQDIKPGMTIEATGPADGAGSVFAQRIKLGPP